MEILILVAIIAAGASGVYVAATFNKRAQQNFTPLMDNIVKNINERMAANREELEGHVQAITAEVQRNRDELGQRVRVHADELQDSREVLQRLVAASTELGQRVQAHSDELRDDREMLRRLEAASSELLRQMQAITAEVRQNSELVKRSDEQVGARQNQLGRNLVQIEERVAELNGSLASHSNRISGIYRYVIRNETLTGSSAEDDSLLLAMLEAESYVDDKGWGGRPHLYALTEKPSTVAADGGSAAGMSGARPDALVLVDEGLSDSDLMEALAGVHWPADVAGCVLVAELAALPPGGEEDAPVIPVAAPHWTSAHPDGRAARLAVGVRRSGEHKCALRIKGEDEVHVRADLAGDLVAALLHAF